MDRRPGLWFRRERKGAICIEVDRIVYVGGPKAALSPYVREEWQSALASDHVVVTPMILRLGDYDISVPGELALWTVAIKGLPNATNMLYSNPD